MEIIQTITNILCYLDNKVFFEGEGGVVDKVEERATAERVKRIELKRKEKEKREKKKKKKKEKRKRTNREYNRYTIENLSPFPEETPNTCTTRG